MRWTSTPTNGWCGASSRPWGTSTSWSRPWGSSAIRRGTSVSRRRRPPASGPIWSVTSPPVWPSPPACGRRATARWSCCPRSPGSVPDGRTSSTAAPRPVWMDSPSVWQTHCTAPGPRSWPSGRDMSTLPLASTSHRHRCRSPSRTWRTPSPTACAAGPSWSGCPSASRACSRSCGCCRGACGDGCRRNDIALCPTSYRRSPAGCRKDVHHDPHRPPPSGALRALGRCPDLRAEPHRHRADGAGLRPRCAGALSEGPRTMSGSTGGSTGAAPVSESAGPSRSWTAFVRRGAVAALPPDKLLPDRQPAYVASWIYVFGVLTIAAFIVVLASGTVVALEGPQWYHRSSVGLFVNSLHLWSVELFFFFMVIHLWGTFFMAAWRGRRALTWVLGAVAFLASVGAAFTGYLVQTNFDSQWIATQAKDGLK